MLRRILTSTINAHRNLCLIAVLVLGSTAFATSAYALCRQALAIGLDISGSVDMREYRLQLDGLADALLDRDVTDAFLALPGANVRLLVYEWGGRVGQTILMPWTEISSQQDLARVATTLRAVRRRPIRLPTALGDAILFGANTLASQGDCWRHTLDLSGDGRSNDGPTPSMVSADSVLIGVTINALVIGNEVLPNVQRFVDILKDLDLYFQAEVIRGPGAFVQPTADYVGFREAMTKKLLKELQTRAVGAIEPDNR
ncbi:MAG: DUF1194 domain-containing protein [Rhodobacteraceae bacterium]|nr:DUF1194 domain-containing protein [Paracoccaceae bacterium]